MIHFQQLLWFHSALEQDSDPCHLNSNLRDIYNQLKSTDIYFF